MLDLIDLAGDVFTLQLAVYSVVVGLLGGTAALGSAIAKRGWGHMVALHSALIELTDPKSGIKADIAGLRERVNTLGRETKEQFAYMAQQMTDLRANGHAFNDRVANIEDRVQQGAVELHDLTRRQ